MGTFDSKQDFVKMEHEMLKFWGESQCFEKLRTKIRIMNRSGSWMGQ